MQGADPLSTWEWQGSPVSPGCQGKCHSDSSGDPEPLCQLCAAAAGTSHAGRGSPAPPAAVALLKGSSALSLQPWEAQLALDSHSVPGVQQLHGHAAGWAGWSPAADPASALSPGVSASCQGTRRAGTGSCQGSDPQRAAPTVCPGLCAYLPSSLTKAWLAQTHLRVKF